MTYSKALDQFRDLRAKVVSPAEAKTYGLHSLRVSGWNGARRGPAGEELAVAQGGWHSRSQTRYDRFEAQEICDLPREYPLKSTESAEYTLLVFEKKNDSMGINYVLFVSKVSKIPRQHLRFLGS